MIGETEDNSNWIPAMSEMITKKVNAPILDSTVFEWDVEGVSQLPKGYNFSAPFHCAGLEW